MSDEHVDIGVTCTYDMPTGLRGWLPIDTVPINTWVLLWVVAKAQSGIVHGQVSSYEPGKIWNGKDYQPNLATHWMPEPRGPQS